MIIPGIKKLKQNILFLFPWWQIDRLY